MHDDPDRRIRWIFRGSLVMVIAGGLLFITALATPIASKVLFPLSLVVLIAALIMWAAILVDRFIRSMCGLPRRSSSRFAPEDSVCPACGYALRGVRGPYCPECGTVRPAPDQSSPKER